MSLNLRRDSCLIGRYVWEGLAEYSYEEKGRIYDALFGYAMNGIVPELTGIAKLVFNLVRPQIDANNDKYWRMHKREAAMQRAALEAESAAALPEHTAPASESVAPVQIEAVTVQESATTEIEQAIPVQKSTTQEEESATRALESAAPVQERNIPVSESVCEAKAEQNMSQEGANSPNETESESPCKTCRYKREACEREWDGLLSSDLTATSGARVSQRKSIAGSERGLSPEGLAPEFSCECPSEPPEYVENVREIFIWSLDDEETASIVQESREKVSPQMGLTLFGECAQEVASAESRCNVPRECVRSEPERGEKHLTGRRRLSSEEWKRVTSKSPRVAFNKPTVEEVEAYCRERNNGLDAQRFWEYYESKGWTVGHVPMIDWKAALRGWERTERVISRSPQATTNAALINGREIERRPYSDEDLSHLFTPLDEE